MKISCLECGKDWQSPVEGEFVPLSKLIFICPDCEEKKRKDDEEKLAGRTKPTAEQTAWVFERIVEHLKEGGSFRQLIYDRLGYDSWDYATLFMAGGMEISNMCVYERSKSGGEM